MVQIKFWDGSQWVKPRAIKIWDGSQWVQKIGKRWTGSAWEDVIKYAQSGEFYWVKTETLLDTSDSFTDVVVTSDGSYSFSVTGLGYMLKHNLSNGSCIWKKLVSSARNDTICAIGINNDNTKIAIVYDDYYNGNTIKVYDVNGNLLLNISPEYLEYKAINRYSASICFDQNDNMILGINTDTFSINITDGSMIWQSSCTGGGGVHVMSNGRIIACEKSDGVVNKLNNYTGAKEASYYGLDSYEIDTSDVDRVNCPIVSWDKPQVRKLYQDLSDYVWWIGLLSTKAILANQSMAEDVWYFVREGFVYKYIGTTYSWQSTSDMYNLGVGLYQYGDITNNHDIVIVSDRVIGKVKG